QQLSLGLSLFPFVIRELLHLLEIVRDRACEGARVLNRNIGICHAQHYPPDRLSQQRIIYETGIDEAAVMLESVVTRMIDATAMTFFAEAYIEHWHAEMI